MRIRILQLGRGVVDHEVPVGSSLSAVLEGTGLPQGLDVRVNGRSVEGSHALAHGDVVTLIPRIKGGSQG